jgi:hypothetical protein
MAAQLLKMRLREHRRIQEKWEAHIDPSDSDALQKALMAAIVDHLKKDEEPKKAVGRFRLEWQARSGPWRIFRAGS